MAEIKNVNNIEVEKGEFILVCGPSGSGKTTLLKKLLQKYNKNDVKTGYVMQNFDAQIVTDKVWHELSFGLENKGVCAEKMHRRVAEICTYFGISDWLKYDTALLSGGEKQLLNLASVMAMTPEILLLDEPTSQLDPVAAQNFLNTVKKLNEELGVTVVITEHRIEDLFAFADRVLILDKMNIGIQIENPKSGFLHFSSELNQSQKEKYLDFFPLPARVFFNTTKIGNNEIPLTISKGRQKLSELSKFIDKNAFSKRKEKSDSKKMSDKILETKNISFSYDKNSPAILSDINLTLHRGEIFAIVGSNGSGKSTLLKILCGIKKPVKGRLKTNAKVRLLCQNVKNLFAERSVKEIFNELKLQAGTEAKTFFNQESIFKSYSDRHPYDLSGGEMQKLALQMIFAQDPDVILLDEPTKGLDNAFKKEFSEILKKCAAAGKAIVLVCHDLEFCAYTADKVSMMFEGQLTGMGSPQEFFGGNNFYTTSANRISRGIISSDIVTEDDLLSLLKSSRSENSK